MDEPGFDVAAALADTLDFLALQPMSSGAWAGRALSPEPGFMFGGFVLAQSVMAATHAAPAGSRLHSLHGYFLRPASTSAGSEFRVHALRDGRSFASRRVQMLQAERPVFELTCSFTADTDGYDYELPGVLPPRGEVCQGPGPWMCSWVGPTAAGPDGTRDSTHRQWCRVAGALPADPHLHSALLAYASDWTGIGGRPLQLEGDTRGMVSLDHSVWFHRPARVDEWLFYDVHSLVNAGGRGLLRGVLRDDDGHIVASVAQEMLLTPS
ncbi:MAG: acyl-CoA thioesterase domain-containing protein [Ilumatobacteraceae bacterium]